MTNQLLFDLDFTAPDIPEQAISEVNELRPFDLQQATLAWISIQEAAGIALKVPTRLNSYKADVAAFWNKPREYRNQPGPNRLYIPTRTVIIECRRRRQDCWPDFTKSSQLLPELRKLKKQRGLLEASIREAEPHLQEDDVLFAELSEWRYERSENGAYHKLCRQIDRLNRALYKGTRFESLRQAHLADHLYLAVPENTVHPHELADGWGLLWIKPDLQVEQIVQAEAQSCQAHNRFHLVQNIAASARSAVLFSQGVQILNGQVEFLRKPKRRQSKKRSSS